MMPASTPLNSALTNTIYSVYAADNTAIVWGLKHNKSKPQRLSGHESPILYADFSADREQVISVTQQAWRVWDLASHTLQHTQKQNHFTAAALTPLIRTTAHRASTISAAATTVSLVNQQPQTSATMHPILPARKLPLSHGIQQVTPLSAQALTAHYSNGSSTKPTTPLPYKAGIQFKGHRHWIQALDFSQQGEHLLSAGYDGSVRLMVMETTTSMGNFR